MDRPWIEAGLKFWPQSRLEYDPSALLVQRASYGSETDQALASPVLEQEEGRSGLIHYVLMFRSSQGIRTELRSPTSCRPSINLAEIGRLPIPELSIPEQRAVAAILGTLEHNKIELNRRNEPNPGRNRPNPLQELVRRFRPRACQSRRSPAGRHGRGNRRPLPKRVRGVGAGADSEGVESSSSWRNGVRIRSWA